MDTSTLARIAKLHPLVREEVAKKPFLCFLIFKLQKYGRQKNRQQYFPLRAGSRN